MDLTSDVFTYILSPLAAFLQASSSAPFELTDSQPTQTQDHDDSSPDLNQSTTWRIDGVDFTARRFFAIPSFALNRPPLRIDMCVPPLEAFPPSLENRVRPEKAFFGPYQLHSPTHVGELEVGRWLAGVLERWAKDFGQDGASQPTAVVLDEDEAEIEAPQPSPLEQVWWTLPFGSTIAVDVSWGRGREEVCLVPDHTVEQRFLSIQTLKKLWADEPQSLKGLEQTRVIDWEELRFVRQIQDTISIVAVANASSSAGLTLKSGDQERVSPDPVVFKSAPHDPRHMYNELKLLLALPAHPNLIPAPLAIVTKKTCFGSSQVVCGFLLPYFLIGSLRDHLLQPDFHTATALTQKLLWAKQIASALMHINTALSDAGFYPDLKPDNILLRESASPGRHLDAVLIDLEQRGGWFAWSPPEIYLLEYLEILAGNPAMPDEGLKDEILRDLRAYYRDPSWLPPPNPPGRGKQRYRNAKGGFSAPWLALLTARTTTPADGDIRGTGEEGTDHHHQLERAQVFMLGKLLWCIFEGQPMVRCGIDHEVLRDPDGDADCDSNSKSSNHGQARWSSLEDNITSQCRPPRVRAFPEFRHTPPELRRLIRRCTAGAPEWEAGHRRAGVVLRGGKFKRVLASGSEEGEGVCSGVGSEAE
ncbi:hypothetical protein VTJ04DRAFT_9483 [Mycothermus thermophilus]|uniref:uncharacterized protein n=1 Tax=Humicola insolens TaxID=85995 RepID=UPI0037420D65